MRPLAAGALAASLLASVTPAAPAHAAAPEPAVSRIDDTRLDARALYFVSYDGLVNNNSFQKNGLLTYRGHQYAAWYTEDRHAVVARRPVNGSTWETVKLPHRLTVDDSHNVISMGISRADGRLHLLMDSHSSGFFYVKSAAGLLSAPSGRGWEERAFGGVQTTLDGLPLTDRFTYPQFVAAPDGRLQLSYRVGVSGNGRNALAEYDGSRWTALGEWSSASGTYTTAHGSSTARNMYLHGIDHSADGTLHAFFTWREQNAAVMCDGGGLTNHDTGYVRSADRGRTWQDAAGRVVGVTGGAHQVSVADASTVADRVRDGRAFHLYKDAQGHWRKTEIPVPLGSSQRTHLVLDAHDNAYAVLPYGRIVAASKASGWTDWRTLYDGADLNAFGEVVVDDTRVAQDGVLSFMYQQKSTGTTPSALRVADFRLPR